MWLLTCFFAVAILVFACARRGTTSWSRMPPGPPGLPLLGNLRELPKEFLYKKLDEWAATFGPIYSLYLGRQPVVVISSIKVAADVLDRMSAVTSDRAHLIKAMDFYTRNSMMTLMHNNELWRTMRRAVHGTLKESNFSSLSIVEEEAAYAVNALLHYVDIPLHDHLRRFSGSVLFRTLYGGPVIPPHGPDPSKKQEELALQLMNAIAPPHSVVNLIPFLRPIIANVWWLRREADTWYHAMNQEFTELYVTACQGSVNLQSSISSALDRNKDKYGLSNQHSIWTAGTLFITGNETTSAALEYLVLALLLHPTVVQKAQDELDAVVGERLPEISDLGRLPYIEAVVKESLRWRTGAPTGLFHVASQDFEYNGYIIPKGTFLVDNVWTMSHAPDLYPNPDTFDPDRFLNEEGQPKIPLSDTHGDYVSFGHGRRVCPGKDMALSALSMLAVYLLWSFHFEMPLDSEGKKICPDSMALLDSFVTVRPKPFEVRFIPRWRDLEQRLARVGHAPD